MKRRDFFARVTAALAVVGFARTVDAQPAPKGGKTFVVSAGKGLTITLPEPTDQKRFFVIQNNGIETARVVYGVKTYHLKPGTYWRFKA